MPGIPELLIVLLIVLLVFGAGKLPGIGDSLGRSIRNFKRAAGGDDDVEVSKKKEIAKGSKAELQDGDDVEDAEVVSKRKAAKDKA